MALSATDDRTWSSRCLVIAFPLKCSLALPDWFELHATLRYRRLCGNAQTAS
jgi:hypothetical protein